MKWWNSLSREISSKGDLWGMIINPFDSIGKIHYNLGYKTDVQYKKCTQSLLSLDWFQQYEFGFFHLKHGWLFKIILSICFLDENHDSAGCCTIDNNDDHLIHILMMSQKLSSSVEMNDIFWTTLLNLGFVSDGNFLPLA
jgi:hypothetical protein